jgi:hypothetical protein
MFLLPVLRHSIKNKLFRDFKFSNLTKTFNNAILLQIIVGVTALLISSILDKIFYTNGNGNIFTETFIESSYNFIVIGLFYYLPAIGLLNIINWLAKKINWGS